MGFDLFNVFVIHWGAGCCRRNSLSGTYTWRPCLDMGSAMASWWHV